jgi:hypothetical protein
MKNLRDDCWASDIVAISETDTLPDGDLGVGDTVPVYLGSSR